MANLHGFGSDAVGNLVNHYTRHNGDPEQTKYRYANQNIDPERTGSNYALFERADPAGYVREQISRATVKPKVGGKKETNVLSDWVVTLPKNPALEGREREFFEQAYAFLCERVPEDMRLGAWVHMDENQPHMHFAFCPLLKTPAMTNDKSRPLLWTRRDEEKNPAHKAGTPKLDTKGTPRYERVQKTDEHGNPVWNLSFGQSKVFTREQMKTFHADLEKAMEKHFGFVVGIQLEDPGEKQLSKLEQKDYIAAKRTLERQQSQIAENTERLERLRRREGEQAAEIAELDREIEQVELQVAQGSFSEVLGGVSEALRGAPKGARTLLKDRGAGKREEGLRNEIEGLRSRISELEGANQRARERVAEIDRKLPGLRGRYQQLKQRFEALGEQVKQVIQRMREVPETVSAWALDIAYKLGKRTYDPNSPAWMYEQARAVASRTASEHTPGREVNRSGRSR